MKVLGPTACLRKCKDALVFEYHDAISAIKELWVFIRTNNWKHTARVCARRKYWGWWFLLAVVIALSVALSCYHDQIVNAMAPYVDNIKKSGYAWIVPLVLLVIVSFPPLMGHEIIILLTGMIWGLGIGFAIGAAGTFLGELATYIAFKYLFRAKAAQLERTHVLYACVARLMRNGGLSMLILVRFSALPGHIVTAIQSTIGIGVWLYAVACFLTLPKQFSIVYLGYVYNQTGEEVDPNKSASKQTGEPLTEYYHSQQTRISLIVFAITTLATVIAAYLVYQRARRIRPMVVAEMEERKKEEARHETSMTDSTDLSTTRMTSISTSPVILMSRLSLDDSRLPLTASRGRSESLTRPQLLRAMESSTSLLGSTWSINDTVGGRSRSSTINSRGGGRSRSSTLYSMGKAPSLPDLTSYFNDEARQEEVLQLEEAHDTIGPLIPLGGSPNPATANANVGTSTRTTSGNSGIFPRVGAHRRSNSID